MSFRRFIFYCTLVGAWAAFLGWAVARPLAQLAPTNDILFMLIHAISLGLLVAFGLAFVDALWNFRLGQFVPIALRVGAAVAIALLGAASCGGLGAVIYGEVVTFAYGNVLGAIVFFLIWTALGLLIGFSVSVFDLAAGFARKDVRGPLKKVIKCAFGGTFGGLLGGIFAYALRVALGWLLSDSSGNLFWSPTAIGFAILGALIGLLVGLSQVVLLEAWVKVEAGFRPGRDIVISRDRTSIGRGEGSDIALFGDNGVERQHALIIQEKGGYFLEPLPNTPGTYINEVPVNGRAPLKTGDQIRVGKSLLRFSQRRKK